MAILAFTKPVFQPAMRIISAITQANPAQVTTTFNHLYVTGTIVRLDIPPLWGMEQLDGLTGEIVVTAPTTFLININTLSFDPFITPAVPEQYPQVVPIGENALQLNAAVQNVLPYRS